MPHISGLDVRTAAMHGHIREIVYVVSCTRNSKIKSY